MADFKPVFTPAAPTVKDGARAVTDIVSTRVKVDVSDEIFQYDPNANALTLLLSKERKKRSVSQYLFYWLEKDRLPRDSKVTTAIDANDVSLTVDDPSYFSKFQLVQNRRTSEVFYVSATGAGSANPLTIVRIDGDAQAMNAGDGLDLLGSAYEEGAKLGLEKSVAERAVSNKTQTLRTVYTFTGRDENTDMFGGRDPMTERKWQAVEHAISIENALWWSVQSETTGAGGKKITTMDGVHRFVRDNVWDLNGIPFTYRSFVEWAEYAMRYGNGGRLGSRKKFLFVAPRFLTIASAHWGESKLMTMPKDKIYGIDASDILTPHGTITLIAHPLFESRGDLGFLIDLNHLRYVYHQGRDTQLLKDRQDPGLDGSTEELLTDCSVQVELAKAHGFVRNLPL